MAYFAVKVMFNLGVEKDFLFGPPNSEAIKEKLTDSTP
jgi:hypothetical protein